MSQFVVSIVSTDGQAPSEHLLLTRINFNPSMDKQLHAQ